MRPSYFGRKLNKPTGVFCVVIPRPQIPSWSVCYILTNPGTWDTRHLSIGDLLLNTLRTLRTEGSFCQNLRRFSFFLSTYPGRTKRFSYESRTEFTNVLQRGRGEWLNRNVTKTEEINLDYSTINLRKNFSGDEISNLLAPSDSLTSITLSPFFSLLKYINRTVFTSTPNTHRSSPLSLPNSPLLPLEFYKIKFLERRRRSSSRPSSS